MQKPKASSLTPAVTSADALADSMQALSIAAPRSSPSIHAKPSSKAVHARVKVEETSSPQPMHTPVSRGVLYSPGLLAIKSQARLLSPGASTTSSESSSQLLMAFFSDAGDSIPASNLSSLDVKSYKLALWQAILVTVGVCESDEGVVMPGIKRPAHFPSPPLPLPTSLKACRSLIQEYVFVNIVNFKQSQIDNETLRLFPK